MAFAKSDFVERYLSSVGADFKYRDSIGIDKLNPEWDRQNPCRAGRAIIDASMFYAERMANGELAPPAIVKKTGSGYILLDGRQRVFAAHTNGATVFSAYELMNPTPRLEALIGLGANQALNGVRPSEDFTVSNAMQFMATFGASVKEAAQVAGTTVAKLQTHLDTRTVRDALLAKGIEPTLANGTLAALRPFVEEPDALRHSYAAIERANATVPMATSLASEMLKQPGKGRIMAVDRWLERPEIAERIHRNKKRKASGKAVIFAQARSLKTVLRDRFDEAVSDMKDDDRKQLAKLAHSIDGKLRQLCGEQFALV